METFSESPLITSREVIAESVRGLLTLSDSDSLDSKLPMVFPSQEILMGPPNELALFETIQLV